MLPRLGETERIAFESGTVRWDSDLFLGMPQWHKLLDFQARPLSNEQQAFIDGPVNDFCRTINDWDVYQRWDLSAETDAQIKQYRLFGMMIPKEYGGHRFSALAPSRV